MDGILLVNKEKGWTSNDVVQKIKKIVKNKVGHTGTLDPLATGVLPLLIGKGTSLSKYLINHDKIYIATIKLGKKTETGDSEGKVIEEKEIPTKVLTKEYVENVLSQFVGKQSQIPPMYSAIKVNGKKLYEYARSGKKIEVKAREIEIYAIDLIEVSNKNNEITFRVHCSKGTYIRSLIRDIGSSLNTFATMTDLIRIKQGIFDIRDSYTLEDIENGNYKLIDIEDVMDICVIENDTYLKDVTNGVKLKLDIENKYILFKHEGNNIALYKKDNDYFRMYIHF